MSLILLYLQFIRNQTYFTYKMSSSSSMLAFTSHAYLNLNVNHKLLLYLNEKLHVTVRSTMNKESENLYVKYKFFIQ